LGYAVGLLSLLPERFPVSPRFVYFHLFLKHLGLSRLKELTEIGFGLVGNPISGGFGTFVKGKLVII
jgi:hypothetical protein